MRNVSLLPEPSQDPQLPEDEDRVRYVATTAGALIGGPTGAAIGALFSAAVFHTLEPGWLVPGALGGLFIGLYFGALVGMAWVVESRR